MKYLNLTVILLLILFGFGLQNFAQITNSPLTNQSEGLELKEDEIFSPCPSVSSYYYFTTDKLLGVRTKTIEQMEKLKFNYSVSGGRIVGTGANVDWDLKNVPIGKYRISVNISGKNFRRSFFKDIEVKQLPECHPICACPSLSIINSSQIIKEGKNIILTAQAAGGTQTKVTYNWLITEGEIFKGQGSPRIQIKTNGLKGKKITATVEVNGNLCAECNKMANATIEIN